MRMIKTILLVLLDMFFVNASYLIGLWLRFDGSIPVIYYNTYMVYALTVTIIHLVVFILFKLYRTMWRYANINEYIRVVAATAWKRRCSGIFADCRLRASSKYLSHRHGLRVILYRSSQIFLSF